MHTMSAPTGSDRLRKIANVCLLAFAIVVSLLAFPSAIVWIVGLWLAAASWQLLRGRAAWRSLAVCLAIIVIKRPHWSAALIAFAVMTCIAAIGLFWSRKDVSTDTTRARLAWVSLACLWTLWFAYVWESRHGTHDNKLAVLDPNRPIVCLGDSLTSGLTEDEAYSKYLQELVIVPVVDWGRAGVTARDMVDHIPEILSSRPQAVVIELGGHDFLRGYGRTATRDSLKTIIEACRQADAAVVLVEIPRGFITDPYAGLERELAQEYDLELIPDSTIRMFVVRSPVIPLVSEIARPYWSDDGLHPNRAGARMLATTVSHALSNLYGPTILRPRTETQPADNR
jgi:acyl-CoA thioesterase-1